MNERPRSVPGVGAFLEALLLGSCLCACISDLDRRPLQDAEDGDAPDDPPGEDNADPLPPDDVPIEEAPAPCMTDVECIDDNVCNGDEVCTAGHCAGGLPPGDGTPCAMMGIAGICEGGYCVTPGCGDGVLDGGEECDDGNAEAGDGCEPDCTASCHGDGECGSSTPCVARMCSSTGGGGRLCTTGYPSSSCDDGLGCNGTDACDGAGNCVSSGDPCMDGLDCTTDECFDGPMDPVCSNQIVEGSCLIYGTCYADGQVDISSGCRDCNPWLSSSDWTSLPDLTPCVAGVCCDGVCRAGGNCCSDSDCGPRCTGTAAPCSGLPDPGLCSQMVGCSWEGMGCSGTHQACSTYSTSAVCLTQAGCSWSNTSCSSGYVCG